MPLDFNQVTLSLMDQYGLIAVFVLLLLDGTMLLPVVPGEAIVILAVVRFAPDPRGIVVVFLIAVAAAMIGSLLLYFIARKGGRPLAERHPKLFMMSRRRREKMERLFRRPAGQSLVLFLRLFPLTRILVSLPAGLAKMPLLRYLVLSTIGMVAFYVGLIWIAFEFRQPNSAFASHSAAIQETYGTPAWNAVQANWVITGAGLILLGVILSVRASRRMAKDPEETSGSLIGTLATAVLFWGGAALAVMLWMDEALVFQLAKLGGVDLDRVHMGLPNEPGSIVAGAAVASVLLGILLRRFRRRAKRNQTVAITERKHSWLYTNEKSVAHVLRSDAPRDSDLPRPVDPTPEKGEGPPSSAPGSFEGRGPPRA